MQKGEVKLKLVVGKANTGRMLFMAGLAKQLMDEGKKVLMLMQEVTTEEFVSDYMKLSPSEVSRLHWEDSLTINSVSSLSDVVSNLVKDDYDAAIINIAPELKANVDAGRANMLSIDVVESISRVLNKDMYLAVQLHAKAFVDDGICLWSLGEFNDYLTKSAFAHPGADKGQLRSLLCVACADKLGAIATGNRVRGMYPCAECEAWCNTEYVW